MSIVAKANEKRYAPSMLEKTRQILSNVGALLKRIIADSQYSDEKIRRNVESVILYPAEQKCGVIDLLRVERKFGTYTREDLKRKYHRRPAKEAGYSSLKTQYSLSVNKVRGVRNVASYVIYSLLCLVPDREAAENLRRPDKAISPTYFST